MRSLRYSILAVLVLSPLAFGSVEPWAYSILNLVALLLLMVVTFTTLFSRDAFEAAQGNGVFGLNGGERTLRLIIYPLFGFIGVVLIQLIPLPLSVVASMSPSRVAFLQALRPAGFFLIPGGISLSTDQYLTLIALVNFICLLIYFLLIRHQLGLPSDHFAKGGKRAAQGRSFIEELSFVIIAVGFSVALLGIIQKLSGTKEIYWLRTLTHGGSPMGPFVNRDHFAGYLEMSFGLSLGLLLFLRREAPYRLLLGFAALLMGVAILYSGSRGGILCFLFEIACAAILAINHRSLEPSSMIEASPGANRGSGLRRPLPSLAVICLLLMGVLISISWIGPESVLGRLHSGIGGDERLPVWSDTLTIAKNFPVFGSGLGTFRNVFQHFHSKDYGADYLQSHNDYAQLLSETGVLGFTLVSIPLATVLYTPLRRRPTTGWTHNFTALGYERDNRPYSICGMLDPSSFAHSVQLGALIGLCGILLHSFFDFNLQIPSNALLFVTLCALTSME